MIPYLLEKMPMPKPAHLMIAIGFPRAEEGPQGDNLNRGQGNDSDGDVAEQIVMHIVECLHDRGPGAVRQLRLLAQSFAQMADAHMERDGTALEDAAADAHKALSKIFGN
jgi:hypothetical protein